MLLLSQMLPIALTNGNDGRTKHFGESAARRKKYTRQLGKLGLNRKPFAEQVDVVVTRILGPGERLMDSSSLLRGNWKELEDSLVELGWFTDDNTKYIRMTVAKQETDSRELGPAILIEIYQAGAIKIMAY